MNQATQWHRKVGIQWATLGDTSLVFFFHAMQARHKKDVMPTLLLDDGQYITKEPEILKELVIFYTNLFAKDEGLALQQPSTLHRILQHTITTLSQQEINALEKKPTKKKLNGALLSMAKGKSSRIDGLTTEVFRSC